MAVPVPELPLTMQMVYEEVSPALESGFTTAEKVWCHYTQFSNAAASLVLLADNSNVFHIASTVRATGVDEYHRPEDFSGEVMALTQNGIAQVKIDSVKHPESFEGAKWWPWHEVQKVVAKGSTFWTPGAEGIAPRGILTIHLKDGDKVTVNATGTNFEAVRKSLKAAAGKL